VTPALFSAERGVDVVSDDDGVTGLITIEEDVETDRIGEGSRGSGEDPNLIAIFLATRSLNLDPDDALL
jgi:hypothetical protein